MLTKYNPPITLLQIPIFEVRSDGRDNFLSALIIAGQYCIPEVTSQLSVSFILFRFIIQLSMSVDFLQTFPKCSLWLSVFLCPGHKMAGSFCVTLSVIQSFCHSWFTFHSLSPSYMDRIQLNFILSHEHWIEFYEIPYKLIIGKQELDLTI